MPQVDAATVEKLQATPDSITASVKNIAAAITSPSELSKTLQSVDWGSIATSVSHSIISFGFDLVLAIIVFYIGRFLIRRIYRLVRSLMLRRGADRSLTSFVLSFVEIVLYFLLIIIVIGILGIQTSSFIALFASAGIAVGMALSGTLQNFAGGVILLLMRPYKVGDYIVFGEYQGFVREIQIFHTIINTYNNDRIVIPNGQLSTGSINNFTAEEFHRIEWRISIAYGDDVQLARKIALEILQSDPRIKQKPDQTDEDVATTPETDDDANEDAKPSFWQRIFHKAKRRLDESNSRYQAAVRQYKAPRDYSPQVVMESFADSCIVILLRAWAKASDYWAVTYDINEKVYTEFPKHGINFPFPQMDVHVKEAPQTMN